MGSKGVRHFQISNGQLPATAVVIDDFNTDNDVLVIADPELSRKDLRFLQNENDTIVQLAGQEKDLAVLKNISALDLDPVTLLKGFYAAFEKNDLADVLTYLSEEIFWEVAGPTDIMPWAGGWNGHLGVAKFFVLLSEGLAFEKLVPTRYIAQGNTVAIVLDGHGQSKYGVPFSGGVVHWVTVRNGKISHLQYYRDTYPIIEAIYGGRPFTVQPSHIDSHYHVIKPVAVARDTDSIVFDPSVFETPPGTVKTVKAMYAALQGLNVPEVRKVFADNVVWDIFGPSDLLSWAGERIGPDAAAESANQIIATMHFDHFKPTRLIYDGDTAAIVIDEAGTSTVTGLPFQTSVVHVVVANDEGKVTLFKNYINTAWIVEAFLGGRPFTVSKY
jgi:ketosteroid isomerase-like protein